MISLSLEPILPGLWVITNIGEDFFFSVGVVPSCSHWVSCTHHFFRVGWLTTSQKNSFPPEERDCYISLSKMQESIAVTIVLFVVNLGLGTVPPALSPLKT